MKHYKDSSGNIYAFESDGSQDAFINHKLTLISDSELASIREKNNPAQDLINTEARSYLNSTSWVIEKMSERSMLGEDISHLLIKYSDIIKKRQAARDSIV